MANETTVETSSAAPAAPVAEEPFGANEERLSARQWLIVGVIVLFVVLLTPWLWQRIERFETGPDYRLPYQLSEDYWLYNRMLRQTATQDRIILLGDSVVWGEYVLPDGALSHFLNRETGEADRFVNAGVNGFFPLAMEGLIRCYGQALRNRKVVVLCNVLWMTSPKTDFSSDKVERINHTRLVPQFSPRFPAYRANADQRMGAIVERNVGFMGWVGHLQCAYFEQLSIPNWTLEDDGGDPPRYPNAWKNPLAQITLTIPSEAKKDPKRGPNSLRHKPWYEDIKGAINFEWVELDASLQWGAFRRLIGILNERGNDVMVVLGPFNEHIIAEENRPEYRKLCDGIKTWLTQNQIQYVAPETLPSALYADASHPLTEGYALLAKNLLAAPVFARIVFPRAAQTNAPPARP
ncbi:MAG: hypothetical protein NTX50_00035 [Candidatus Sumerlaeota bacterium]|nr:hypothetical protein [Candidatus Sumerlaeota bacterium]